jgi:tRNA A-37 threonylcarbamoyl transferase component Bud32
MSEPADLELQPRQIADAGRDVPAAFVCRLLVEDASQDEAPPAQPVAVRCRQILRLLPGRRLVARVEVAGRTRVMKLFLGADAGRYARREAAGVALLRAAGAATPDLVGRLVAPDGSARGLLFAHLDDARPIAADALDEVLGAVAELARLHRAGAAHRDPHLDNFLRRGADGRVFLIDGDGVRRVLGGWRLGWRGSIDNLGYFCAQRSPLADDTLADVYAAYADGRGWPRSAERDATGERALQRATRRQRRARVRRYLLKAERDCTEFCCERSWRRVLLCVRAARDPALDALLADPERAVRRGEVVKAGNSATVVRVRVGERTAIVKRYNQKNAWHALRRALKPQARFRLAWRNGQRLHFLGIPTARPLALIEGRFGPLRGVAYLVMEDLGSMDLASEAAAVPLTAERIEQVVALFRGLRAAGLRHGDTKASNFIAGPAGLAVVDLDAMTAGIGAAADQAADLRRFLANFVDQPGLRERFAVAFAAAEVGPLPGGAEGFSRPPPRL